MEKIKLVPSWFLSSFMRSMILLDVSLSRFAVGSSARTSLGDVARALDVSLKDADRIAKLIPDDLKMTLTKALDQEPDLRTLIDSEPQYKKLYDVARRLEGLARHSSIHAGPRRKAS